MRRSPRQRSSPAGSLIDSAPPLLRGYGSFVRARVLLGGKLRAQCALAARDFDVMQSIQFGAFRKVIRDTIALHVSTTSGDPVRHRLLGLVIAATLATGLLSCAHSASPPAKVSEAAVTTNTGLVLQADEGERRVRRTAGKGRSSSRLIVKTAGRPIW
jgi:hypothetical protein